MEVQPRRYRFRLVNGSNARFYIMQMFNQQGVDMHQNGAPGPGDLADRLGRRPLQHPGQAGRSGQRAQRLRRRSPVGNNVDVRRRGQVPVPRAGRARRRDRRLRRPGREDLHDEELRGHPLPQRQPGRIRRARRDGGRPGHAVQGRPAAAGDRHDVQPGRQPPGAARRADRQHQDHRAQQEAPADPGRGRRRHRQPRRPRLARRRRRSGREPDQQHQVERQPRGDDHAGPRLASPTAAACRPPRRRRRARPSSGRSPT